MHIMSSEAAIVVSFGLYDYRARLRFSVLDFSWFLNLLSGVKHNLDTIGECSRPHEGLAWTSSCIYPALARYLPRQQ
jgi:hypothetical protein